MWALFALIPSVLSATLTLLSSASWFYLISFIPLKCKWMHISEYWKESLVYNITSSPWKYVTRATHTPGLNNLFRKINKTTSIKSFSQVQRDYILLLSKRGPGFGVDWTSLCPGFLGGGFVGVIFLPKVLQKYRRFIFDEKTFFFLQDTNICGQFPMLS